MRIEYSYTSILPFAKAYNRIILKNKVFEKEKIYFPKYFYATLHLGANIFCAKLHSCVRCVFFIQTT